MLCGGGKAADELARKESVLESMTTFDRLLAYLQLNKPYYMKVEKLLRNLIKSAQQEGKGSSLELLKRFASKCYARDADPLNEAKRFLEALYGNLDDLYNLGPKRALVVQLEKLEAGGSFLEPRYSTASSAGGDTVKGQLSQDEAERRLSSCRHKIQRLRATLQMKAPTLDSGEVQKYEREILNAEKQAIQVMELAHLDTWTKGSLWNQKLGKKYFLGPQLGVGGTAVVKLGMDIIMNQYCAVKILNAGTKTEMEKEVEILRRLDHPNILRVRDVYPQVMIKPGRPQDVFILDFAENGEMIDYLIYTQRFETPLCRWFFRQCVAAVEHNFQRGVVHRDIKHDNLLLGNNFQIKFADYGFAKFWSDGDKPMQEALGTACYAAPEILSREGYSKSVDIYSLGIMLFVALVGRQPFKIATKKDKYYKYVVKQQWAKFWASFKTSKDIGDDAKDLLQRMLQRDPKNRATLGDIKAHPWFNGEGYTDDQARDALRRRKDDMDRQKKAKGLETFGITDIPAHRAVGEECTAIQYWTERPDNAYWFASDNEARVLQSLLEETVTKMDGNVRALRTEEKEEEKDDLDLSKASLAEMKLNVMDDANVKYLADGRPDPYGGFFEIQMLNKDRTRLPVVKGFWEIFTEPLNESDKKSLAERIARSKQLLDAKEKFQTERLAKLGREADDSVILSELETVAKNDANEYMKSQLDGKEFNPKLFYTEDDRVKFGKKNFVVFTPEKSQRRADPLGEAMAIVANEEASIKDYNPESIYGTRLNFKKAFDQILKRNNAVVSVGGDE